MNVCTAEVCMPLLCIGNLCWCCKGVGMYVSTLQEEVWVGGGGGGGFQGQGNSCLV